MSKTAVLILNWNGSEDTVACVRSLVPHVTSEDYVFIIDNGSTDDSIKQIGNYYNSAKQNLIVSEAGSLKSVFKTDEKNYLVCNKNNLGFGAGNNIVLSQLESLDSEFEHAWLLNNDAIAAPQALSSLKNSLLNHKNVAAVGSLVLNYPDTETIQCAGVKHYRFFGVSKLIHKNMPVKELDRQERIDFDYLNGASFMLRLKSLEKTGYFDERFFLYSEELDLQLRLQKNNYKLLLDLNSEVFHKLGGGTNKKRYLFFYYYNSSAVLLSKKHYPGFYTFCAVVNLVFITLIRTFPSFKSFTWGIKGIVKGLEA